eukprot:TRINITY_DN9749_c0_g1_i1.p1 TRINITY_DN9749_c0_g1~~TRINITY_DN9749_c0_g1_i1.p1  ORF type:complete len:337 (-),score=36.19 TRINITY_DN9749_c0_g1_i1:66-1076(-)
MQHNTSIYPERWTDHWCKAFSDGVNCTRCYLRYTGPNCETDVFDDTAFLALTLVMQILSIIAMLVVVVWGIIGFVHLRRVGKLYIFHPSHYVMIAVISSMLIRIVTVVDIFTINEIFDYDPYVGLYWVPFALLVWANVTVFAIWLDLIYNTDIGRKVDFKFKLARKISFAGFFSFFGVVVLTLIFGLVTTNWALATFILNTLVLIASIIMVITDIFSGKKMYDALTEFEVVDTTAKRIFRLVKLIFTIGGFLIMSLLLVVAFYILHNVANTNDYIYHWAFMSLQYFVRINEIGIALASIMVIVPAPKKMLSSLSKGTTAKTEKTSGSKVTVVSAQL